MRGRTIGETKQLIQSAKKREKEGEKKLKEAQLESTLNQDLSKWTPKQHGDAVKHLAKQPLKELRRRQDLVYSQQKIAHKQWQKASGAEKKRLERGMSNLDIMNNHITEAINKREFGG